MVRGVMLVATVAVATGSASLPLSVEAQTALAPTDQHDGLPVASAAGAGLDTRQLLRLDDAMKTDAFPRTTSVLIVQGGKLVYEAYFNGGGPDTLNDTRSATKSITALAVGAAIADGRIAGVSAPAFGFLADQRPFANDGPLKMGITIEDLLTMSSALACNDNENASPGNENNMYPLERWIRWVVDLPVQSDYRRDQTGRGPFAYCTAGVFLLGQIVQRATGQPVDQYVEHRLLAPLGISAMQWSRSPSGEPMTGGGLRLRSRDLAKLGAMTLDSGRWKGQQVVPSAWIARAHTVQRHAFPDQDYGYLFWRRDYTTRCGRSSGWYMAGNGGNAIVMLKDLDAVVVVTRTNYNTRGMHQQTTRLLEDYVFRALPCPDGGR